MKRILLFTIAMMALASCSLHKASAPSTPVYSPVIETATMASLEVSENRITYTYVPAKKDAKALSQDQLIRNAVYAALEKNGGADELVGVNYFVSIKRGFFSKKVKSVKVSGYPAYYKDFREPGQADLEKIEILSRSRMFRKSELKSLAVGTED